MLELHFYVFIRSFFLFSLVRFFCCHFLFASTWRTEPRTKEKTLRKRDAFTRGGRDGGKREP